MSKLFLKSRSGMLFAGGLLLALFMTPGSSAQVNDSGRQIRLILGESSTEGGPGTVVVNVWGYALGEDGVFPAISSDHQQIAILHVDNSHDPSTFLEIISVDGRSVVKRFELVLVDERKEVLNADDRDVALATFQDKIRDNLEEANQYLLERSFQALPKFYKFPRRLIRSHITYPGEWLSRVWELVAYPWMVTYDFRAETFYFTDINSGDVSLSIKRPRMVYGYARPGMLCIARHMPYQSWLDKDSGVLVVRLTYVPSGDNACDRSDKWLVELLSAS